MKKECVFCSNEINVIAETTHAKAFYDKFPVSNGHVLIIPKEHYETYFDLPLFVKNDMFELLDKFKLQLDDELSPSGYNIGINSGVSAGQTVFHCHIHLIPRYDKDMDDPSGGVRAVIPSKQKY
jgi:diadenosine tetraphosphate (Ap4A) HIT family hydrolase